MSNSVTLGLNSTCFSHRTSKLLDRKRLVTFLRQMSLWADLAPKLLGCPFSQARLPVCPRSTDLSTRLLTFFTIKSSRGLQRGVVHHKILPISDRRFVTASPLMFLCSVSLLQGGLMSKVIAIPLLYLQYPKPKWAAFRLGR